MDKIITIIFIGLLMFSNSEYKRSQENDKDPIIGTWKIVKTVSVNIDGTEEEYFHFPYECFTSNLFVYKNDGTIYFKRVLQDKISGECYEKPKDYWTGSWSKKNDGNYIINNVWKYSEQNTVSSVDSTNIFTFSNNNKVLKIYDDYVKSGTSFPDNKVKAQYAIFERVKINI